MTDEQNQIDAEHLSLGMIAPGVKLIIAIGRRVRKSILDYALGAAILGLVPVYGRWIPEVRLSLLVALNLKMIVNIGRFWGNHHEQGVLDLIGCLLTIVGSLVLGIATWLIVIGISLFLPWVDSLARALAYGVTTWSIGLAVSRYYYNPQTLDLKALARAVQFERSHHNRK